MKSALNFISFIKSYFKTRCQQFDTVLATELKKEKFEVEFAPG